MPSYHLVQYMFDNEQPKELNMQNLEKSNILVLDIGKIHLKLHVLDQSLCSIFSLFK